MTPPPASARCSARTFSLLALLVLWLVHPVHPSACAADAATFEPIAGFAPALIHPCELYLADDGTLYGRAEQGGPVGVGGLFQIDSAAGTVSTVVDFSPDSIGSVAQDETRFLRGILHREGETGDGGERRIELDLHTGELATQPVFSRSAKTLPPPAAAARREPAPAPDRARIEGIRRALQSIVGREPDGAGYLWDCTMGYPHLGGTIDKQNVQTGEVTTVLDFRLDGAPHPGLQPTAHLTSDGAGYLWGTSQNGRDHGPSCVFKVHAATGEFTRVADFPAEPETSLTLPKSRLVSDGAGCLWGTSLRGGPGQGGFIFKIDPRTGQLTIVLHFSAEAQAPQGRAPGASLTPDDAGFFWGTTSEGGRPGHGTLFKLEIQTGQLETVVEFTGEDGDRRGEHPLAALIRDREGNFWGTTYDGGGQKFGTVFKLNPNNREFTTVAEFSRARGKLRGLEPASGFTSDHAGYLWGITHQGGFRDFGTLYKLDPRTGEVTTVWEFSRSDPKFKGVRPRGELVNDGEGDLWGVVNEGGGHDAGGIYRVKASTGEITGVTEFDHNAQYRGAHPSAGLICPGDGYLWGTTSGGGLYDSGTLFKLNLKTHEFTTVVDFAGRTTADTRGAHPGTRLVFDGAGYLWGSTSESGRYGFGTLFKLRMKTGELTTIADLGKRDGPIGAGVSGLISDGAGSLWGTSREGGELHLGTVFKIDRKTGRIATVIEFTGEEGERRGSLPVTGLTLDRAGNFWGLTYLTDIHGGGTIFRLDRATGKFTHVAVFTGDSGAVPGQWPTSGPLLLHRDGKLYGVASRGGITSSGAPAGGGQIFRLTPKSSRAR